MDNISALKRQAERLLAKMEGKRYVIGDLNKRLQSAAEEHPHDTVIQAVARVENRCFTRILRKSLVKLMFKTFIMN